VFWFREFVKNFRRELPIRSKKIDVCRMNILLLGSGGREHAFAHALSGGKMCTQLFIAPGNPGTAQCGTNIPINILDFESVASFCIKNSIGMLVVGPEEPLVRGLRDYLEAERQLADMLIIGPRAAGAMLEGSKDFSKAFMKRHQIPTARSQSFHQGQLSEAIAYLKTREAPFVIKASGLAAGKGVVIAENLDEAVKELDGMLKGKFGDAGRTVVIEEFLDGIECSVFVLTDGSHYLVLPEAKDYKRVGEGDTGLNTGGMGAVSPVPFYTPELAARVEERIIRPTIEGLKEEGIHYQGFIFLGLMIVAGEPYLIEYNCRMGDPETEAVLPRIQNDLSEILIASGKGNLKDVELRTDVRHAHTVVCVSSGYPEAFEKGYAIEGLDNTGSSLIFHAGTRELNGQIVTSGGRVLACTSLDLTPGLARAKNYEVVGQICFEGMYYRRDIGLDLMKAEQVG